MKQIRKDVECVSRGSRRMVKAKAGGVDRNVSRQSYDTKPTNIQETEEFGILILYTVKFVSF